jgi:hypothetical protein
MSSRISERRDGTENLVIVTDFVQELALFAGNTTFHITSIY